MAYKLVYDDLKDYYQYEDQCDTWVGYFSGPPEQIAPASLVANIAAIVVDKFLLSNITPVRIRVYADTSPTLETKYRVEAPSYASGGAQVTTEGLQFVLPTFAQFKAAAILIGTAVAVIGVVLTAWKIIEAVGSGIKLLEDFGWILALGVLAVAVPILYRKVKKE